MCLSYLVKDEPAAKLMDTEEETANTCECVCEDTLTRYDKRFD